jgi:hypothetical protein
MRELFILMYMMVLGAAYVLVFAPYIPGVLR